MMTRRSLSWKLSKALERSGASDPRVTVALLNIGPKSAVGQATAVPRAPAIGFPLPCLAPAHSGTFAHFFSMFRHTLGTALPQQKGGPRQTPS